MINEGKKLRAEYDKAYDYLESGQYEGAKTILAALATQGYLNSNVLYGRLLAEHGESDEEMARGIEILKNAFEFENDVESAKYLSYHFRSCKNKAKPLIYNSFLYESGYTEYGYRVYKDILGLDLEEIRRLGYTYTNPMIPLRDAAQYGHLMAIRDLKKIHSKSSIWHYVDYLFSRFFIIPMKTLFIALKDPRNPKVN